MQHWRLKSHQCQRVKVTGIVKSGPVFGIRYGSGVNSGAIVQARQWAWRRVGILRTKAAAQLVNRAEPVWGRVSHDEWEY